MLIEDITKQYDHNSICVKMYCVGPWRPRKVKTILTFRNVLKIFERAGRVRNEQYILNFGRAPGAGGGAEL